MAYKNLKGAATAKQKKLLDKLGIGYEPGITKQEASDAIEFGLTQNRSTYLPPSHYVGWDYAEHDDPEEAAFREIYFS